MRATMGWDDTLDFMNSVVEGASNRPTHKSPPKRAKKKISLVRWRIAFSASSRGVLFPDVALQVEGIRTDDGEHWTSSEVLSVELPRTIHTANTIYYLVGKIDTRVSLERGMPHEFIDKFTNGFPLDWKEAIDQFIDFLFQHAGRQRAAQGEEDRSPKIEEVAEGPENNTSDIPSEFGSPARMASLSPLNSPSTRYSPTSSQTPTTNLTESPFRTPPNSKINMKNVTVRRTAQKKRRTSVIYNAAPTPVLNRSQRGRVIKPRLAPGERIFYDCYGDPIEARKDITRTHISNRRKSDQLDAVCKALDLEKAKSPTQAERRLSSLPERSKSRKSLRQSISQQRSALSKMLAYDERRDVKKLDEYSFADALTPIQIQRPTLRRFIQSDDEDEDIPTIQKRSKRGRLAKNKSTSARGKRAKSKRDKTVESLEASDDNEPSVVESTMHSDQSETETTLAETSVKTKPKGKVWNAKNKRDLEAAFRAFNPCTDKDWQLLSKTLPVEWPAEELRMQAKKMKLQLTAAKKPTTPKTTFIDKIRTLVPDGKLPGKGTYRREALKEELMQHIYVRRNEKENENVLGEGLDDSDDLFIREAMKDHALDDDLRSKDPAKYITPSKRTYFPKAVSALRRRSSLAAINSIGDDFSLPDKSKANYRLKYRAQQFNRRHGMNSIQEQEDAPSSEGDE